MHNGQTREKSELAQAALLRLPSVIHLTGLGRSTIYRMITRKEFPRPVRLGLRSVAWRQSDLSDWIEERAPTP